jgi:hypothetical protein
MPELHETRVGQIFFEHTMPCLVEAVKELTKELKRSNDLKEKEEQ